MAERDSTPPKSRLDLSRPEVRLGTEKKSPPPKSPLIEAILRVSEEKEALNEKGFLPGAPSPAPSTLSCPPRKTPWRRRLEELIYTCVPESRWRARIDERLNSIESAAGPMDAIVLPTITAACHSISALHPPLAYFFLGAMGKIAILACKEYPDSSGDSGLEKRADFLCASAEKLRTIASRVSDEWTFYFICVVIEKEKIKDFKIVSKYLDYMHSASEQLSSPNPKGVFKSPRLLARQAVFISHRLEEEGATPEYIDAILSEFTRWINELSEESY